MLRLGLFLYDHLDWHMTLPKSIAVDLPSSKFGVGLKPVLPERLRLFRRLGRRCAAGDLQPEVGARDGGDDLRPPSLRLGPAQRRRQAVEHRARRSRRRAGAPRRRAALVNAAGPWVKHFLDEQTEIKTPKRVRLIKGSHIIVPRLHDGDHAFILQNSDNRIVFVIPYERDFSLIGTTDIPVEDGEHPVCSPEEIAYLCELASRYMAKPVRPEDVVWTYSGVRPLFDDGDDNPLEGDARLSPRGRRRASSKAPILSVFGGKITTYRRLAEHALRDLAALLPAHGRALDRQPRAVYDGEMADAPTFEKAFDQFVDGAATSKPGLPKDLVRILARRHGSGLEDLLENVKTVADLGRHFGGSALRGRGPPSGARRMGGRGRGRAVAPDQGRPAHDAGRTRGLRRLAGRAAAQLYIT